MSERDDLSKRRGHHRPPVVPKGPTAQTPGKAPRGMRAAMQAIGKQPTEKVEGTLVNKPLPAPQMLPKASPPGESSEEAEKKTAGEGATGPRVDPAVVMGNAHAGSLEALLASDKLAKPTIQAWKRTERDETKRRTL